MRSRREREEIEKRPISDMSRYDDKDLRTYSLANVPLVPLRGGTAVEPAAPCECSSSSLPVSLSASGSSFLLRFFGLGLEALGLPRSRFSVPWGGAGNNGNVVAEFMDLVAGATTDDEGG